MMLCSIPFRFSSSARRLERVILGTPLALPRVSSLHFDTEPGFAIAREFHEFFLPALRVSHPTSLDVQWTERSSSSTSPSGKDADDRKKVGAGGGSEHHIEDRSSKSNSGAQFTSGKAIVPQESRKGKKMKNRLYVTLTNDCHGEIQLDRYASSHQLMRRLLKI
ncbi:unnamed protein product [Amoebophrya sp. A25]|nr:unnamed protein product [Amoebophrya sp. A25]|eukprot:GSA25T00023206001.1